MSEARPDFTVARYQVLELARDRAPIPVTLRHVALGLEAPHGVKAEGLIVWAQGGNFTLTASGAALLQEWAPRAKKRATAQAEAPR